MINLTNIVSLLTLIILELVLDIDNLVFLSILSHTLPKSQQKQARQVGLLLAWSMRLLLLASAIYVVHLVKPVVVIYYHPFSTRDLFLLFGGLFLVFKATQEIHGELEPRHRRYRKKKHGFIMTIFQIAVFDIIFSLDSVLTAIGLTQHFSIMATSITIAIIGMVFASEPLSYFIEKHPTVKMLALSFLMLIGTMLIADAFQFHIPRAYIYCSMGFSMLVEILNLLRKKNRSWH